MKSFTGSEIAFNQTYFSSRPDRVIEVKTDSQVQALLTEVPESAGSYSFPDNDIAFHNRVLFWRTEGSRILFNEVSATSEVPEPSLCIDLAPSVIIAGTSIVFYRGVLIITIPTHSAIHQFSINFGNLSSAGSACHSVLSSFPRDAEFFNTYDCHYFPNGITISKAAITHDFRGDTICVVCDNKFQLASIRMPYFYQQSRDAPSEVALREGSILGRLIRRKLDPTLDLTLANFDQNLYAISAQTDGHLRIWSAYDGVFKGAFSLAERLRSELDFDIDDLVIKAGTCCDQNLIIAKMQMAKKIKFVIMSFSGEDLELQTTCDLYAASVVDFLFVESSAERKELALWVISRESYEENKQSDAMFQPYLLRQCLVDLNATEKSEWQVADPAVPSALMDKLVFENFTVESIKQRIFDSNTYSFETVQRAIQTICKCPTVSVQYRDWQALSRFTEEFIQSGQFIQMFLSDQDQASLITTNTLDQSLLSSAHERFWLNVQKCCNQFQETSLYPIAVWHSPTLGLFGTIQPCRFTVYMRPDDRMHTIVSTHGTAIEGLFDIIKRYIHAERQLENAEMDEQLVSKVKIDVLCRIVKWFGEREDDVDPNLVPMRSAFLESSFSTALMATALQQRVLDRLSFAKVVSTIVARLPEIFTRTDKSLDQRSLSVINSQLTNISATVKHYGNLWFALSATFLSRMPNSNRAPRLVTIAQSFFKSGLPFSHDRSEFLDEDLDDMQVDSERDNRRPGHLPEYSRFLADALNDAMVALWPESKSMTFPRFLAQNSYFESLKDFCEKNQPYVSELAPAFNFFQGVAYSGTSFPDHAAGCFEEASQGIVAENEVLNGVLSVYTGQLYTHKHSLTEFYYAVMNIFKARAQTEYVIRAGMFAIKFAREEDPLLPTIYALLFNQYVSTEQYFDAIRVLHLNPCQESQENCLRGLVNSLWETQRTRALVTLHYGDLTDRVAELLESKCHLMPLQVDNGFFETVYAFHMHRYDYEAAARIMYFLCWRLRWVPQSREVIERRLRVLSCVCQTVEMLPENYSISFEADVKELLKADGTDAEALFGEDSGGKFNKEKKSFTLKNTNKKVLYDEYLLLESRLALVSTGEFPNGPPVTASDIYEETIAHRLYDTAFVVQQRFNLDGSKLFNALTLNCIAIGFDDKADIPAWVFNNCHFVDYGNNEEDYLKPHWKLLVAFLDLALKIEPADVLVLEKVAELFLERSLPIPKWLESRYLKVNARYFYNQLIEFDELDYAFQVLSTQLQGFLAQKLCPQDIHLVPSVQINSLFQLAAENAAEKPNLFEMAEKSRETLTKIFRSMKIVSKPARC